MLTELRIANFGVIERLTLQFQAGFSVLTGETGAGKSLLIDALTLVLGGRASVEQIRSGADEARLEAVFSLSSDHPLLEQLRHDNFVEPAVHELIVHRVISTSGKSRSYLNANPVPLRVLEQLGGTLVDIHGQHDQQSLLIPAMQMEALDAFGHLRELRAQHEAAYKTWMRHRHALAKIQLEIETRRHREEFVRYQLEEIRQLDPQAHEDDILEAERRKLAGAQRLRELARHIYAQLYEDDNGILQALANVKKALLEISALDAEAATWRPLCEEPAVQLQELAGQIRNYSGDLEDDPERLEQIEQRLDRLGRLKKKYGGSLAAIAKQADILQGELTQLEEADTRLAEHAAAAQVVQQSAQELAGQLSRERVRVAKQLQQQVSHELTALKMERTRFEVLIEQKPDGASDANGQDIVQFLLSANPGESPRPLARVASGGELSRVMLALKTILSETDRVPTLIFDEVDAGVGGAVAELMGKRLRALGAHHQVLCVTHWAQVASQAHRHYVVEKSVKRDRTMTRVRELLGEGREKEIARMLGGVTVTEKIRATANEMIGAAQKRHG